MTIRELAKIANVSPATVSIVLNGQKGVREETRKKVLRAAETYRYNLPRRKTRKTKTVLLLKYCQSGMFVEENQGFISAILDAIEEQLRFEQYGMTMMVAKTDLKAALGAIQYDDYCGMIVIATEILADLYDLLQQITIPFSVVDNAMPHHAYSSISINNDENVRIALDYCMRCGHKDIGYLGSLCPTENFDERYRAFNRYTREFGISFKPFNEFRVTPTMIGAHDDFARRLAEQPSLPKCFFAENDTIALGTIKAMEEKGYKIPQDVSIIGFDDIAYASISSPTLTTIHVQREAIGKQTVFQLLQYIENPKFTPVKTQITGILEIRDSVRNLNR